MKRRYVLTLIPLAAIAVALPSFISEQEPILVHAGESGYKNQTLPTTIDLNPVSVADIRSYYSALDGKDLSGENLLKALKPILKNGQQYHSYDVGKSVWQAYEITDRDWELSPASSTTYGTYDAATNTITGYKYGTSGTDAKNNPYQHLFYRNRGVAEGNWRAWDQHGKNDGTDREHIWPKSRGFGKDPDTNEETTAPGARGDLHHLVAGDSYVNSSTHSNYAYGFVDKSKPIGDDAGEGFKINDKVVVAGNYRGVSLTLGSGTVFEPQDCDKGDIARACFYMVARYNNLAGDDDTIDGGNPNLYLDDTTDTTTILSTATKAVSYGILKDLLAWHHLDPVDEYEIHRNDLIYRNFDKNRNPFIDYPEWVDAVWGTVTLGSDNRTIVARDATPKGKAAPATDEVYKGRGDTPPSSTPSSSGASSTEAAASGGIPVSPGSEPAKASLPLPVIIAIAVAAVIIVIVLVIVAVKGKGKAKKTARKILKGQTKSSGSKKKSSSSGSKKKGKK